MAGERLQVWLDDVHVADLERRGWQELRCRYTREAQERWPGNSPVISCSLPLSRRRMDARAFCKGLLPEGQALQALAARARLATIDVFGLLRAFGRDVAGALVIAEDGPRPDRFGVEPYSPEGLAAAVDALDEQPLGADDDSELSLAGLQDKLLLVQLPDGGWGRPLHGRPSTHILKRDDLRRRGLVRAEADCLRLAHEVGLTDIDVQLQELDGVDCLIVSRFDRVTRDGGGVERVHQEDLCQATGTDPDGQHGRAKYERAGGPGFAQLARLLETYAADPSAQLERLAAVVAFTVLIGNADAHAKNLALLHPDGATVELAPLYDTVPTRLWPKLRAEAAMAVAGKTAIDAITLADVVAEAVSWPLSRARATAAAAEVVDRCVDAVADGVVDAGSPVADLVRRRATAMRAGS